MFTKHYASVVAAVCAATLSLTSAHAAEKEQTVKLSSIPAPAAKALEKNAHGAKITKVSKETEAGKAVYEAKYKAANGGVREVSVDAAGKVQNVEDVITLAEVPKAPRKTIEAESNAGKLVKVERVTTGKVVTYKAIIALKGQREKVVVSSKGKVLERKTKKTHHWLW
jgi:hypothetical protein